MEHNGMIRKHIFFSGRVQGVGFRYRSCYIAQMLGLTGWVTNTWDDRVEMEVQGEEKSINKMNELLHEQNFVVIEDMEVNEIPLCEESGFRVR